MNEEYKEFAAEFAKTIIDQDFQAAHKLLAPWLQQEMSADDLQQAFEKELLEMNEIWEIEELIYPEAFEIDGNSSSLASLKEENSWRGPRQISPSVTDQNFRKWLAIEFLPDETDERVELDGWFDFWAILVEVEGQLKIGFFEFEEVD